jgi:sigma-54-specific transcriptional regulator
VLQERQVVRLGSREPIEIDVRVVAATNIDLEEAVSGGRFREDLYFRLNVATLHLAPLRERRGDILPLARHFLGDYSARLGVRPATLSAEAETLILSGHSWPGNIRELENVIHHALLVCRGSVIRPEDLNLTSLRAGRSAATGAVAQPVLTGAEQLRAALLALCEEEPENLHALIEDTVIRTAFEYCHRNQVQTARLLSISRNIVRARLAQCGEIPPVRRVPLAGAAAE